MAYRTTESWSRREEPPAIDPLVERLAWLMDASIPLGARWSIGLDAILGLIPGAGDLAGALVSGIIIVRAAQAGIPREALARMLANVAIDSLLGAIPLAGDVFDFAFKSNTRNARILAESLQGRRRPTQDWAFVILVLIGLFAVIALPLVAVWFLLRWLWPTVTT